MTVTFEEFSPAHDFFDYRGTLGYGEYLEALADPQHEAHEDMLQWRGPFDPAAFGIITL
jgi:hypothetical protein